MGETRRVILHVDMDAFYASVEQRDNPDLRGKPVIVGGPERRGVVSTCSYEARTFGVRSAMPMAEAMRRCPQAIVVPPRMKAYSEASAAIMRVFRAHSPDVEPLSLDEAFVDMSGSEHLFGTPLQMADKIRREIWEATGLTASVGCAPNKFLAKVASDLHKPNGVTELWMADVPTVLHPLPIERMWGIGQKTAARFRDKGFQTIGDLARCPPQHLNALFGSLGTHVARLARGEDARQVSARGGRKSVGAYVGEKRLGQTRCGASASSPM